MTLCWGLEIVSAHTHPPTPMGSPSCSFLLNDTICAVMMDSGGLRPRGCRGLSATRGVTFSEPAHQILADHRAGECYGVGAHLARRDIRGMYVCRHGRSSLRVWRLEHTSGLR